MNQLPRLSAKLFALLEEVSAFALPVGAYTTAEIAAIEEAATSAGHTVERVRGQLEVTHRDPARCSECMATIRAPAGTLTQCGSCWIKWLRRDRG